MNTHKDLMHELKNSPIVKMHNGLISDVRENPLLVSLLTQLKTICIIRLVINGLGIITTILMFIPVGTPNQEYLQRRRRLVLPRVVWCFIKIVSSVGFFIWFHVVISHVLRDIEYTTVLSFVAIFDFFFYSYAAVIGISYYQLLNQRIVPSWLKEHAARFKQIVMMTPSHPLRSSNLQFKIVLSEMLTTSFLEI